MAGSKTGLVCAVAEGGDVERVREVGGWRQGKPVEDPDKMKRWGFVMARPSEYLVHVRGGQVRARSSGQGATCFKLPWDAVAVVPTSLQRLRFVADQVTREKVGVEVVGLAVYRIADPLLAYRLLNFSFPERAQEKLEETLTAMFIGATRRLIANLPVEDCMQKRKSALAVELLAEVAPIVGGAGKASDTTDRGWGVVIDTIEVQEVRVMSEKVFAAMQEPYRAALDRQAREARAEANERISLREVGIDRQVREARLANELALEQAALAAFETRVAAQAKQQQLERANLSMVAEQRRLEAELAGVEGRERAQVALLEAQAEAARAEAEARLQLAQNLPALAAAVGQKIESVRITQLGADAGNPFAAVTQAVGAVLELVRKG